MGKKPKNSDEENTRFEEAVSGVKRLIQNKIRLSSIKQSIISPPYQDQPSFHFSETEHLPEVRSEEFLTYKHHSISHKTLRKLRKGQYNVDAILDLHGMSVEEAREAVASFLEECLQEGVRVALIIHGKGHHKRLPVLKNKLNHWLRQTNDVLAFCSAAPIHGSRGALYILLKKTNTEF